MSNARERESGRLGRPRPGHLASLSGAHSPVSSAEACLCPRGKKGARETMGRTSTTLLPFSFLINYCYYYWNTKREQRREARGTRKRNAKWLGCGRSGLALFAGSHRSPLEENSSLEPTLCQGVAVPSVFFVFFLSGKGSAMYAKLPSFYASILSFYANPNNRYLWVIKTILSSISFCHEYVFRGISVFQVTRMIDW